MTRTLIRRAFRRAPPLAALLLAAGLALEPRAARADLPEHDWETGQPLPSIASWLPMEGDPLGWRRALARRGVVFNLWHRQDVLGNVSGGQRRGFVTQGLFEPSIYVDFERLAGLPGLTFFSNGFVITNTGRMRRDFVGGVNTIAAIEAIPAVRLSELWIEQRFLNDRASLRLGQLTADVEFFFSDLGNLFLQADFPTITALNLPGGGPAYPQATPGIRLRVEPRPDLALLVAAFNGNPAGPNTREDDELANRHNTLFRLRDPALFFAELQWRRNTDDDDTGLATVLKFGGWFQLGRFDDLRFDAAGGLRAQPGGAFGALRRTSTSGLYAVLDQQLWRPAGAKADDGISFFGRIAGAPQDRNPIGFFFDAGLVFAGLIPGRPEDRFGFSLMYAQFSNGQRAFERDTIRLTGEPQPVRNFEMNLEVSYLAQIRPGFDLQPILTYVWNPDGVRGTHATVVGFRTSVRF